MNGAAILTDILALCDKNSSDTAYRTLALKWYDLVIKDISNRQEGYHWRFLEAQTYFATAENDFDYKLSTTLSGIDTTKIIHVYDKVNDITYTFVPYEKFRAYVADESNQTGDPYIFTIYAGNLILYPAPSFAPVTGAADATVAKKLSHSTATFITDGVKVGMIATDTGTDDKSLVTAVDSEILLSVDTDIFINLDAYSISLAIHVDYVKLLLAGADSSTTILIPDKYKYVLIEGILKWAYQFDKELGDWQAVALDYEAGIARMKTDNHQIITEVTQPVSHRERRMTRVFPLAQDNM